MKNTPKKIRNLVMSLSHSVTEANLLNIFANRSLMIISSHQNMPLLNRPNKGTSKILIFPKIRI